MLSYYYGNYISKYEVKRISAYLNIEDMYKAVYSFTLSDTDDQRSQGYAGNVDSGTACQLIEISRKGGRFNLKLLCGMNLGWVGFTSYNGLSGLLEKIRIPKQVL